MRINNNTELDSSEELYFQWWCEELKEAGYINNIFRQVKSFELTYIIEYYSTKKLKTKSVIKPKTLLREHHYTPDFIIEWNIKSLNIFYDVFNIDTKKNCNPDLILSNIISESLIEVKPIFDQNNMTRLFTINQKWMMDKYKLYVNKIIPEKLFEETFTPRNYLFTTITKKQRKIKFKIRTLDEFIKQFEGTQKILF